MADLATKAVHELQQTDPFHGIISAGGTGGTSLASSLMRRFPLGVPKVIVSTVAVGDTAPIVGDSDIVLVPSIVDVAGLNEVLKGVLESAAGGMVGMAGVYRRKAEEAEGMGTGVSTGWGASAGAESSKEGAARQAEGKRKGEEAKVRLGITMFGVTTPAVDRIRAHLDETYAGKVEVYVFHATGTGGRAMERLLREGRLDAVLDLTTTEVCDYVAGGIMSAGEARLDAATTKGLPMVLSLGACDMVNFGPWDGVPERYRGRRLHKHNDVTTLMRTNEEECEAVGEFIVRKLRRHSMPEKVVVYVPEKGVSMISTEGGPFEDREADEVLFGKIKELEGSGISIVREQMAINDEEFAVSVADEMMRLVGLRGDPGLTARDTW
ncbi:hypothetical protein LTS18_007611 [Coniosporium uncinatum]|uniref:Uncharacterized protein n=1 Tax=Coniosporium uncinatum TaxID=93489 RepID=A0ACC3DXW9_9PEZI|nr:hypothetical protein LTS18_007611 [Coniosporium uncinatum]